MKENLNVQLLKEKFSLQVLINKNNLDREIKAYGINRAGLELAGFFAQTKTEKKIILFSTKESEFVLSFPEKDRSKKYKDILEISDPPCVIITNKFKDKKLLINIAKTTDVPILETNAVSTSDLSQFILDFEDSYLSENEEIHGTFLNIFGSGVLIIGESGIGKSEISLELISKNHLFVGDDRIIISKRYGKLNAKCHPVLKNLIEVRGIGIIDITKVLGHKVLLEISNVDLVIEIENFKSSGVDDSDRLGESFKTIKILDVDIPYIKIPVSSARNIPLLIEYAVGKLKMMNDDDYENPVELLNRRIDK